MAAMLIEIKSRMLLPVKPTADTGEEPEDPRAELVRRLLEYEQMKLAARARRLPQLGRDFLRAQVTIEQSNARVFPDVSRPTCARPGPTSSSAPS
jgi:segregation and condensation protein A